MDPIMGSESKKTTSRYTTEKAQGTHAFEIVGYSLKKGIGVGEFIHSGIFNVGGYDWAIRFYPDGAANGYEKYVSVYLELKSGNAVVRASYDFRLVNQITGLPKSIWFEATPGVFKSCIGSCFGLPAFLQRDVLELEASGYIKDDCLTIECALTVIKESQVSKTTGGIEIEVPPSDLSDHFGKLLLEEEGADVTFSVKGETFAAHKIVLAARSPVLKAELYGQMMERKARHITIEDIQPDVFRALLHFIYNDSLPDMDDLDDDEYSEMTWHLLLAADRYAIDRLKLLCQSIFAHYLDVESVATTLALAEQHNCASLKDVCIEFIASSDEMDALVATQGYKNLRRTCPSVLVDVLERTSRLRKT